MSEERFFNQVKSLMQGYQPEVPQQAYGQMRRALWWSNFTQLSATRFNMWYLLLLLGAGAVAIANMDSQSSQVTNYLLPSQPSVGINTAQIGQPSAIIPVTGEVVQDCADKAAKYEQHLDKGKGKSCEEPVESTSAEVVPSIEVKPEEIFDPTQSAPVELKTAKADDVTEAGETNSQTTKVSTAPNPKKGRGLELHVLKDKKDK